MSEIKKDQLLIITDGSYSDYRLDIVCKSNINFDINNLKMEFLDSNPDQLGWAFIIKDFIKWLIDKGYISEMKYEEIWIGDGNSNDEVLIGGIHRKWSY